MHTVELYAARPYECDDLTFHDYFRTHRVESVAHQLKDRSRFEPVGEDGQDLLGNYVYKLLKGARVLTFTEYNPGNNLQAWAYQHLLRNCTFRNESDLGTCPLVDGAPEEKDYFGALIANNIVKDMEDVHVLVDKYCTDHLVNKVHRDAMCSKIETMYPCDPETGEFLHDAEAPPEISDQPEDDSMRQGLFALEFEGVTPPNLHQKSAVDAVLSSARAGTGGVHVITGGPGAGKTHVVRYITHTLRSEGVGVALTATTGKAAKLLSGTTAYTLHKAFRIPAKGIAVPIDTWDPRYGHAKDAKVIIVDECSMLSAANLRVLHSQLMCTKGIDYLDSTVLVFVGDPKQLPPVCKHGEASMDTHGVCRYCPLPRSTLLRQWKRSGRIHVHRIAGNQRLDLASSPLLSRFLEKVRVDTPTQEDIDTCLGPLIRSAAQVTEELQRDAFRPGSDVAVCTHRKDARSMNEYILRSLFDDANVEALAVYSSAHINEDDASRRREIPASALEWCEDPNFHELQSAAIDSHVMFTANSDEIHGYANGDTGTVTAFRRRNGRITAILVTEARSGKVYPITRTVTSSKYILGKQYVRRTFPLSLAYAMTGHKCQGQTFTGRCFAFLAQGFVSGLAYVMLSRSTMEDNLRIITSEQGLHAEDFHPMPDLWEELERA